MKNDKDRQQQDNTSADLNPKQDDKKPVSLRNDNDQQITEEDGAAEQQRKEAMTERD